MLLAGGTALGQVPAGEAKGGPPADIVPARLAPAAVAACQFATQCGTHAIGTFLPNPSPDCVGQFGVRGEIFTSQIDRYSMQGTAGQGFMAVLRSSQLSDPVLILLRASDNSLVKGELRRGIGPVTVGLVLPETTTYFLEVASMSTPTAPEGYTLDITCETGGKPDLNFTFAPTGWSAPVVVSSTPGSFVDAVSPTTNDSLYFDITEINRGSAPVTPVYVTAVELDGEILYTLHNDNLLPNWYVHWEDVPIDVALSVGTHSLTVRIDPGGVLGEANVQDNSFTKTFSLSGTSGPPRCLPDDATLCLNGSRYRVRAIWYKTDGTSGQGHAVPLTRDTGYFWFFGSANIEAVLKVLEACAVNGKRWVFASGLTNVRVEITVTDMVTVITRTYENPPGVAFQPVQDTNAFSCN